MTRSENCCSNKKASRLRTTGFLTHVDGWLSLFISLSREREPGAEEATYELVWCRRRRGPDPHTFERDHNLRRSRLHPLPSEPGRRSNQIVQSILEKRLPFVLSAKPVLAETNAITSNHCKFHMLVVIETVVCEQVHAESLQQATSSVK